ncbi:MAG: ABC transporter permease [Chloroflexota bacterium]
MTHPAAPRHNSLQTIWTIFQKETLDNLRDRRSIFSSLSGTLIGPALIVLLIVVLGKTLFSDAAEKTLLLPVIGAERAPMLVQFLEQNNVTVQPGPADPQQAVRSGDFNLVLIIPEGFGEDFSAGRPAQVQFVIDSTRQSAFTDIERARSLVDGYGSQIATLRLLARGVSPLVIHPIRSERVDVATPQSQVTIFLNMMPYFIVLVVFTGGMYVVIDATAGERERGSLEPLLINPALRRDVVLGKLAASVPFALFAVFLNLLAFSAAFNLIPLEDYLGFQLTIDPLAMVGIFLIAIPMVLLASAVQMIVASFTRSFKEAQTYVSFLPLVPALPGMLIAFLPVKPGLVHMLVPTFGQQLIINQLMRGEPVDPLLAAVSTVVTLVLAAALVWVAVRLYQRERVVFGGR